MRVLLNMMVWNCSTSRKSGDLRCASRRASLVIKEAVPILASTEDAVKSSSLRSMSTCTLVKCPRTVMRPMCLAENSTCVCIGSTAQLILVLRLAFVCLHNSCVEDYRQAYIHVLSEPQTRV